MRERLFNLRDRPSSVSAYPRAIRGMLPQIDGLRIADGLMRDDPHPPPAPRPGFLWHPHLRDKVRRLFGIHQGNQWIRFQMSFRC